MASLQEQLLKAGLTTKQKTRQANADKRKKNKQQRSGVDHGASLQEQVKQDLLKSKAEKVAKDSALNDVKKQEVATKEQLLRIKQILEHHQLTGVSGESEYNYTFNNKVKKLSLNTITHKALVNGRLALCGLNEITYLVTSETAAKVAELDHTMVLVQNDKLATEESDEDDPYADYQIPDDLMW
ncbi:DUF2058 domain-containing protein [Colwellia sp. TT2012]|uniref:DUF2058 domain-containing protein n=1 Tax=Colwellia sp. TT2012 TaxID=1720342 RepID=UPI00070DFD9C|nr:DUF2058 domain-containing protein [Colwellia sp. TT2012]